MKVALLATAVLGWEAKFKVVVLRNNFVVAGFDDLQCAWRRETLQPRQTWSHVDGKGCTWLTCDVGACIGPGGRMVVVNGEVTVDWAAAELVRKLWRSSIAVGGVLFAFLPPFRLIVEDFPPFLLHTFTTVTRHQSCQNDLSRFFQQLLRNVHKFFAPSTLDSRCKLFFHFKGW